MSENVNLARMVGDDEIIRYFYLDRPTKGLLSHIDSMRFELVDSQEEVPFNAQVKSYLAARDDHGDPWIAKPVASDEEMTYHRACAIAYLLDHATGTLAAPTTAVLIDGRKYRISKVVRKAVQISSYNYLEEPFIGILRSDLINRWIYFDEDRNPNNYLVITNKANKPFVVAIDYDKADLCSTAMKITGTDDKFGWHREEKTRFLTLLRPDNFDGVCISSFEPRLQAFAQISERDATSLAEEAFRGWCDDCDDTVKTVVGNFLRRRNYVDAYFRSMFKSAQATVDTSHEGDYAAFGKSFLDMHEKKK